MDKRVYLLPPPVLIVLSSLAQLPTSYFAKKGNILNVYFVKILWIWVTASFLLLRPKLSAASRYVGLTIIWIFMTQWFFGPAIIDRSFTMSGGACEGVNVFSQAQCKLAGGKWSGGHDISGHVFLLTLSSVSLWLEILQDQRTSVDKDRQKETSIGSKFALTVSILSMWMLMMTAAYFHTWFEKFTGLLAAYAGIFVIYWLPDFVPALQPFLGLEM